MIYQSKMLLFVIASSAFAQDPIIQAPKQPATNQVGGQAPKQPVMNNQVPNQPVINNLAPKQPVVGNQVNAPAAPKQPAVGNQGNGQQPAAAPKQVGNPKLPAGTPQQAINQCAIQDPQQLIDCGFFGITQAECIAQGCCWAPLQTFACYQVPLPMIPVGAIVDSTGENVLNVVDGVVQELPGTEINTEQQNVPDLPNQNASQDTPQTPPNPQSSAVRAFCEIFAVGISFAFLV